MGLKNSQYHAIMRKYEQKQLHSHDIQVARYEEVYKKLPEFKTLDDSIASLSIQHGKKLLDGDTSAVDALKKDLAELRNRKIHLLKSAGFPEDYLEPVYDCPDCKDTGYIGNKKCHCFKKAIIGLLYDQSNIKKFPVEADFSNFRLDYYPVSHYDKKTGRSSRSMMEDTLRICHHFIDSFGTEFNNLFFYGDVGVGKTFLSTCIAKEIMNREYSVLYFSAPQLFNTLAKNALMHITCVNTFLTVICLLLMILVQSTQTPLLHHSFLLASMKGCCIGNQRLFQQTFLWSRSLIFILSVLSPELQADIVC